MNLTKKQIETVELIEKLLDKSNFNVITNYLVAKSLYYFFDKSITKFNELLDTIPKPLVKDILKQIEKENDARNI